MNQAGIRNRKAVAAYALFNFAKHYALSHKVTQGFEVDDAVLQDFRKFLDSEKIPYTEAEMIESNDWLRSNIKSACALR